MYCRDTGDVATEHVAGLSRLKHYYAGQTQITDRSLEILGGMTSLEEVELSACAGISDRGLVHLARLPQLKKVSVDATARVLRRFCKVNTGQPLEKAPKLRRTVHSYSFANWNHGRLSSAALPR